MKNGAAFEMHWRGHQHPFWLEFFGLPMAVSEAAVILQSLGIVSHFGPVLIALRFQGSEYAIALSVLHVSLLDEWPDESDTEKEMYRFPVHDNFRCNFQSPKH